MKKVLFISLVSLLFVSLSVSASKTPAPEPKAEIQVQSNVVCGMVCDKLTQETLAGAVITANGQKVYTDLDGNFTLPSVDTDKCKIKVSLISYQDQTIEINRNSSDKIQIKLQQR